MPYDENNPLFNISQKELDEIAEAFDELHEKVKADLGESDARYIRSMITLHRRLAAMSRIVAPS